jgi:hypothetical protein
MLDQLAATALIGTSRSGGALPPPPPGALGDAIGAVPNAGLLDVAAMVSNFSRCARNPILEVAKPPVAEPDELAVCSRAAGELLEQLIVSGPQEVVAEWFELARRAKQRPPHRLLPRLLDYAAQHKAMRDLIVQCLDHRGQWLIKQPDAPWRFAAAADEDVESVWETGNRDQRLAVLRRVRETNPSATVALVQSTWKDDAAEDRVAFVEVFRIGLSDADEPFLESCLDDRSKQARLVAADLLARLPNSQLVRRMIERVAPRLKFVPAESGSMLKMKKAKHARIEVTLPEDRTNDMIRDGIEGTKADGVGYRQNLMTQMLACVPPTHWSLAWNVPPRACVEAAAASEFGSVLINGWTIACGRNPNVDWIHAIWSGQLARGERAPAMLLSSIPPQQANQLAAELLARKSVATQSISEMMRYLPGPLDADSARLLGKFIATEIKGNAYDAHLVSIIQSAGTRVPPALYTELSDLLHTDAERLPSYRSAIDSFFSTLGLRRDIHREFGT